MAAGDLGAIILAPSGESGVLHRSLAANRICINNAIYCVFFLNSNKVLTSLCAVHSATR